MNMNASNDDLLVLYACFKQATVGDCNTDAPPWFDLIKKSKYDAWKSVEGSSAEDAMTNYILKAKEVLPSKK